MPGSREAEVDHLWTNLLGFYFSEQNDYGVLREAYIRARSQSRANVCVCTLHRRTITKVIVVENKRASEAQTGIPPLAPGLMPSSNCRIICSTFGQDNRNGNHTLCLAYWESESMSNSCSYVQVRMNLNISKTMGCTTWRTSKIVLPSDKSFPGWEITFLHVVNRRHDYGRLLLLILKLLSIAMLSFVFLFLRQLQDGLKVLLVSKKVLYRII